ncbi:hypothetical protein [Pedobacter jamesrossensis]|uniref:Uncharacterized protein n=1 Tax=Pedobacter jamesrossensis TaxID=1908238 RepID=A0ABV8NHB7_9SPHI
MKNLIIFIAFVALSQQAKAQQITVDTSFMQAYCPNNYDRIDDFFDKGKTPARTTADKNILVFALPDLQAKQVDKLEHFTDVTYLKEGTNPKTKDNWVKISYKMRDTPGVYKNKVGYILEQNISHGTVVSRSETENLSFVLTESPLLDADLKMPRFRLNAVNRFTDLNYEKVKSVNTYDLNMSAINFYNHFYLTSINNNAFNNMPNLLRLYWHHGESCPESEGNVFVAHASGKMSEIISASSTGEGGFYETTKVYLPLKFAKGKVVLVENGDSENMLDSYTGTLKTIPYPKDCGIPIEQLVVVIEEDAEGKTDVDGNFIEDKNKEIIMEITHKVIRYYKWNGSKFLQVKKVVVKQRKEN